MTALLTALGSGVSAQKILQFLMRKSPQLAPKIQSALASGLSAEKVLKWFSKGANFDQLKGEMESEYSMDQNANPLVQAQNIRSQNLAQDPASSLQRHAPGVALAIGASLAAPYASRAAQSMLSRALPPSLTGVGSQSPAGVSQAIGNIVNPNKTSPATAQQPPTTPPMQGMQSSTSSQPPVSPSIPNQAPPVQPEVKSINVSEIFSKYPGFETKVKEMLTSGNSVDAMSTYFKTFNASQTKKLEKEAGKPIEEIISEYIGSKPQDVKQPEIEPTPEAVPIKEIEMKALPGESTAKVQSRLKLNYAEAAELVKQRDSQEKTSEVEPIKIEKGSLASSPQGVGEVKEIRNGKAIIEVDGKKHQVNEDELEKPKYTEDEIADAYDRMVEMIPEEYRSGYIQWAGYNEDENSLGYIPRGGKYEKIYDITPEEAQMIKEGKGTARTSGEEREGIWVVGEDTRGGVISQIVHDRRRKHEAVKKQQLEFPLDLPKAEKSDRGMKPIFDELAYPRGLSKARDKKKAEEERARKKAEKERLKKEKEDEKRKKKRQG